MPRFLTIALLMLLNAALLRAQDDWDAVLDRYSRICDSCLELRTRIEAGEKVPDRSVTELLGELGRLRTQLGESAGSMTPAQRRRFKEIRQKYEGLPAVQDSPRKTARKPKAAIPPAEQAPEPETRNWEVVDPLPGISADLISLPRHNHLTVKPLQIIYEECIPWRLDAAVQMQLNAGLAAGIFVAASRNSWGGYLSARSNFRKVVPSYNVSADGKIEGGGLFWGNGVSDSSFLEISAGPVWLPARWLAIYAGAGYGLNRLVWQDAALKWASVTGYGGNGLAAEAGVILTWKQLDLLGGVWLQNGAAFTFGAGWRF